MDENSIITDNEGLVFHALKKYSYRKDYEDILQEGRIGLLKAYRCYKKDKGHSWGAFAVKCICQYVNAKIIKAEKAQKRPQHVLSLNKSYVKNYLELTEYELEKINLIEDTSVNTEFEILNKIELENCLKFLNEKDGKILLLRYQGATLREIGKEIHGLSYQRIWQILNDIYKKLKAEHII